MSVSWWSRQGVWSHAACGELPSIGFLLTPPEIPKPNGRAGAGELLGAPQNDTGACTQKLLFSTLLLIELIDETQLRRALVGDRMRIRQDSKLLKRERKDQN